MRLLWSIQYRFYKWLQHHTRSPRDVADYLAVYPDARYALRILTPKMQEAFGLVPVRPALYRDPECGGMELHLVAYIPATMTYEEVDKCLDKVHDWMADQPDWFRLGRHIGLMFEWTEEVK